MLAGSRLRVPICSRPDLVSMLPRLSARRLRCADDGGRDPRLRRCWKMTAVPVPAANALPSFSARGRDGAMRCARSPISAARTMVVLALGCGLLIERFIGLQSILLVFLMAVIGAAIAWGLFPSLFACVLSVVSSTFFWCRRVTPSHRQRGRRGSAVRSSSFVALIVSNLTAALRSQIVIAQSRARTTAALYAFSRQLAGIGTLDELLRATTLQISSMLDVSTVLLLPRAKTAARRAGLRAIRPTTGSIRPIWRRRAVCWEHGFRRRRGPKRRRLSAAVSADAHRCRRGRRHWRRAGAAGKPSLTPEERRLLDALADQAAVAIERVSLAGVVAEAECWPRPSGCAGAC